MGQRKKILFLTHYFPPEVNAPANRTYEHCKLWADDFDVNVITNFPNHPDGKIFTGYKNKLFHKENIDGINTIRVWTFITPNEGFVLRTLNYMIYMIMSVSYVILSNIQFDLVIATSPQFFCGLAGKYIGFLKRKPFVLELRDLWPESIVAVGAIKNKWLIKFLEGIEYRLYSSAKAVISVTQSFKDKLIERGIDNNKIYVIYNGVSIDIFKKQLPIKNIELKEFLEVGFIIGYIGTIGMAHSVITLIEAATLCTDNEIKFVIVGSGAERLKLEREIINRKLNNIRIFSIQPKDEIPAIIKKLNVFVVHLKKQALFKTVIPSKMFEGMIMRKAILIGVDGESRKIVEDAQAGIYFEPENPNDLLEKILWLKNDNSKSDFLGNNGYDFVVNHFDRKVLAVRYKNILNDLLS
jgi:glycosyltransferase involved in cell wall biosynthesis